MVDVKNSFVAPRKAPDPIVPNPVEVKSTFDLTKKPKPCCGTYTHVQATASDTWIIPHNLGKHPSITVVDSAGSVNGCEKRFVDENTIILIFGSPFKGKAYLN